MNSKKSSIIRLATAGIAISVSALWLTGCGKSAGSSANSEITILTGAAAGTPDGDQLNAYIKDFTKRTGIQVKTVVAAGTAIKNTFETSTLAGHEADIVNVNLTSDTNGWLKSGLVINLSSYLKSWGLDKTVLPQAVTDWSNTSGVQGIPLEGFNWPIWYNMDLLKKAGVTTPPSTIDQLISASQKLRAAGIQPLVIGGAEWPVAGFTSLMAQQFATPANALKVIKDGGFCTTPGIQQGLALFQKLRDSGVFVDNVAGYTAAQMTTAYFNGRAAMLWDGSWDYGSAPAAIQKTTTLSGFPLANGGTYSKPTMFRGNTSAGFFISKNGAKKIGELKQFFQGMYSNSTLKQWVHNTPQVLAVQPSAIQGATSTNPLVTQGNQFSSTNTDFPIVMDTYLPAGLNYQPAATQFLASKETPAQFCKALDQLYATK